MSLPPQPPPGPPVPGQRPAPPPPPAPNRSNLGILLFLTFGALLVFAGGGVAVWWATQAGQKADVSEGSFLKVELSGALSSAPQPPSLFDDPDAFPPTSLEVAAAIRHAAEDDRIDGLYLVLDFPQAGWGTWQELRDAVHVLREAGKPCVAHAPFAFEDGGYYLASACDQIVLSPNGAMFVNGLALEQTYYKGTFDEIGVEPEYEHVGDFKSFIEVYEREGPSEQAAAATDYLLDDLYAQLLAGVAEGRGWTTDEARARFDAPVVSPQGALDAGWIDALAYDDAVPRSVHRVGEDGWRDLLDELPTDDGDGDDDHLTPLSEYVKDVRRAAKGADAVVAVLAAEGSIMPGDDAPGLFGGNDNLTDGYFARWMTEAREDDRVKAVVVHVSSPGGSAVAAGNMWREVVRTQAAGKPVVISMGDYAASGGYLLSAPADLIVAQPGTITGSIGVFGGKFDLSGTYGKLGLSLHSYKRGELADMLSFTAPFSDPGRAAFREFLETFYDRFVGYVASGREMSWEAVHEVAQGRVWTGTQALERGLVDELGGLDLAVTRAAELAELDEPSVLYLPRRLSFFEMLAEELEAGDVQAGLDVAAALGIPDDALTELRVLEAISRSGGLGAYLPGGRLDIR